MAAHEFLRYLGDCIRYVQIRYPSSCLVSEGQSSVLFPQSLSDTLSLHDSYESAMFHGILYEKTGAEKHRVRFVEDADRAYRSIWREKAKGRRALPGGDGQ